MAAGSTLTRPQRRIGQGKPDDRRQDPRAEALDDAATTHASPRGGGDTDHAMPDHVSVQRSRLVEDIHGVGQGNATSSPTARTIVPYHSKTAKCRLGIGERYTRPPVSVGRLCFRPLAAAEALGHGVPESALREADDQLNAHPMQIAAYLGKGMMYHQPTRSSP